MPYRRLKQAVRVAADREAQAMRVAAERKAQEERNQWLRAAFIGYQLTAPYRNYPLSFGAYLDQVGLGSSGASASVPTEDLAVVKARALAIGDDIEARDKARR